jgi:hypothetical protein
VPFKKTIITSVILILLAHTLISIANLDTLIIFLCVMAIFTGIIISYLIIVTRDSMFDDNNQLKIPYSKITFFYVIAMFISKYYFQYIVIVDKKILNDSLFEELYVLGFSILTGLLIGKSIGYFHNIKKILKDKSNHLDCKNYFKQVENLYFKKYSEKDKIYATFEFIIIFSSRNQNIKIS